MKQSEKQKLRMYAGDLSGLYGMRDVTLNDGRGKGMRAIELRSDKGLECTVLADRCLDVPYLSYKGINLSLVTKAGLSAPWLYVENGTRGFLKQFNAGTLTTCGILHSGGPMEENGIQFGLHGNIGNTPAENVNKFEEVVDDAVSLVVTGEVREACVFGESLRLHRKLAMLTEQNVIRIEDTIENCGFETQPLLSLYHINFGYPLLDEGARVYFSASEVSPRDEAAAQGIGNYHIMEAPEVGRPEQCYVHTGGARFNFAMVHNERLGLAAAVHYDAKALPILCQWKCMHAGDYALGLEPSAASFDGLEDAKARGWDRYVEPGQCVTLTMWIEILDDPARIQEYKAQCKESTM